MPADPAYVRRLLDEARTEGQWHAYQPDAAAKCFEVLALLPDHREAAELVYEIFCDEWLIYDNRVAVQRNIDEWDDRPHQQRRRLALSFRFMSRWRGWDQERRLADREGPADVRKLLDEGRGQLLEAYCLGDEECVDFAWPYFTQAIEKAKDPRATLLWVGKQYADLGFFADAVEVLAELVSRYQDEDARRLLAEVRWWRDNAYRIPWIPPAGDGSRYRRMMAHIDPTAPSDEELIQHFREEAEKRGKPPRPRPSIDPALAALIHDSLPPKDASAAATKPLVDWSFLDRDDGQPGEPPDWLKKQLKHFPREMAEEMYRDRRWTRQIAPPKNPPRYNPDEPPFDPAAFMAEIEGELDDAWEEDEDEGDDDEIE
jgi:hypothetical protein